MSIQDKYMTLLTDWQNRKFRNEVTLVSAAKAAREGRGEKVIPILQKGKWIYVHKDTDKPAVFTFAVQWHSNSDLQTGDYVPYGEDHPDGQPGTGNGGKEGSLYISSIRYQFDLTYDNSIVDHIKAMEERAKMNRRFNIGRKQRHKWQDGSKPLTTYEVSHRLFNSCYNRTYKRPSERDLDGVHQWLVDVVKNPEEKNTMLNLPMPSYFDYTEGQPLMSLFKSDPPGFVEGDIVVITFRLGFYFGKSYWKSEIMPLDFIRVAKAVELCEGTSDTGDSNWLDDRLVEGSNISPFVDENIVPNLPLPDDSPTDGEDSNSIHSVESMKRRAKASGDAMEVEEDIVGGDQNVSGGVLDDDRDFVVVSVDAVRKNEKKKKNTRRY